MNEIKTKRGMKQNIFLKANKNNQPGKKGKKQPNNNL